MFYEPATSQINDERDLTNFRNSPGGISQLTGGTPKSILDEFDFISASDEMIDPDQPVDQESFQKVASKVKEFQRLWESIKNRYGAIDFEALEPATKKLKSELGVLKTSQESMDEKLRNLQGGTVTMAMMTNLKGGLDAVIERVDGIRSGSVT